MVVAGLAAAVSVALPYVNAAVQPNLFDAPYADTLLFFGASITWPLGVPLGFIVLAMAFVGVLLGALVTSRRGGRGLGMLAIVCWLGLGGASIWWWLELFSDITSPGTGAIIAALSIVVGIVASTVVAFQRPAKRPGGW